MSGHQIAGVGQEVRMIDPYRINRIENRNQVGSDPLVFVDMPPKELELLYFLASSPNQVFTREQLLDHIWGYEYIGDTRTVDVHIKRLREKIRDDENWALSTVWGIGYKFEVRR